MVVCRNCWFAITLDVMHCKKNLCKNVVKTIFGNKDIMAGMEDLKDCGIWSHLWLQATLSGFIKPIVFMSYHMKKKICKFSSP